jgi:transcription initiation factor TFIIIB Brf1 subunit/transcription initiation factor TFIIB
MSSSGPTPWSTPQVKSLNCPSCGATLRVRSFGHAVTIVCDSCHCILDAQDPKLQILQKFKARTKIRL